MSDSQWKCFKVLSAEGSDRGGEGDGGAAPPPPRPLSSPLAEAKPSLTSTRWLQRIPGSCFTLPPQWPRLITASSSNSSPKPHHDLDTRSSEDASTRNIFITPNLKGMFAFPELCVVSRPHHAWPVCCAVFTSWKYWCMSRFSLWNVQLLLLRQAVWFTLKLRSYSRRSS